MDNMLKLKYEFITEDGQHNFDAIEKAILSQSISFGNPDSRLTPHEQFLHWKNQILTGEFKNREEWSELMAVA